MIIDYGRGIKIAILRSPIYGHVAEEICDKRLNLGVPTFCMNVYACIFIYYKPTSSTRMFKTHKRWDERARLFEPTLLVQDRTSRFT